MSMLEDLFLEDEAGEAQELERVLEGGGDDYDERPVSPNSDDNEEREDEAVEDKRRVDPTQQHKEKRIIKNPRFVLNPARLTGPRGIQVIPDHFKDFKFKGKGHEKEDLDMVLKKLEHWAYRLYPKFEFHDCLKKIEMLGKKRPVMVHLKQIRSDQFQSSETVVQNDSSDDEAPPPVEDEFDKLLQQQIEIARATPVPGSVKKTPFSTPSVDRSHMMPKATSSPSISEEQRERMIRNRQLAEERRLAKLRNNSMDTNVSATEKHTTVEASKDSDIVENSEHVLTKKHNRSNVIDSSDSEDEVAVMSESIVVDVHKKGLSIGNDDNEIIERRKSSEDMDVIAVEEDQVSDFDQLIGTPNNKDSNDVINNEKEQNNDVNDKPLECEQVNEDDNAKENEKLATNDKIENHISTSQVMTEKESSKDVSKDENNQSKPNVEEIDDKDINNETSTTATVEDISKDKNNSVCNKENVDSNVGEEIMDIDFNDDF